MCKNNGNVPDQCPCPIVVGYVQNLVPSLIPRLTLPAFLGTRLLVPNFVRYMYTIGSIEGNLSIEIIE